MTKATKKIKVDTNKIVDTEYIGRALYGKKDSHVFTEKGTIRWEQFYDDRFETDLSVDRMGNYQINQNFVKYLSPRAQSRNKYFRGWGQIQITKMRRKGLNMAVYPDPINDEDESKANILHAQIDRTNFRGFVNDQNMAAIFAVALAHLASESNVILPSESA